MKADDRKYYLRKYCRRGVNLVIKNAVFMRLAAFCKRLIITLDWRLSGMTEREKMINGELYDSADKELEQLRLNARK